MNLPLPFIGNMQSLLQDEWRNFELALEDDSPVSVRINDKIPIEHNLEQVPWCPKGFYLAQRPVFTMDPLFHAGCYYVQEASSMFLYQVLNQCVSPDSMFLDMCAAPGGKSTLISDFLSEKGFLVSNEYVRSRAYILAENLTKWGNANMLVCNNKPEDFEPLGTLFDAILVDAPCSGEGMFRKDERAVEEWSLQNVETCVLRQHTILNSAWKALKPGGVLIYSTCTYNRREDEELVQWLIENFGADELKVETKAEWGITTYEHGYRFFPHKTKGEGLFMAVVRKPQDASPMPRIKPFKNKTTNAYLTGLLKSSDEFDLFSHKNVTYAVRKPFTDVVANLLQSLNALTFGIAMSETKGKNEVLQPALALNKQLNRDAVATAELSYDQALAFLRCESFPLPDTERGFVLVTYKNVPLGWMKNVGNRCNNLYPSEWRIRMNTSNNEPWSLF